MTIDYCLCHTHVGEYIIVISATLLSYGYLPQKSMFMHVVAAFLGDYGPELTRQFITSQTSRYWLIRSMSKVETGRGLVNVNL